MWNTVVQMAIMMVITVLKSLAKDPKTSAVEGTVIAEIAAAATEADFAMNGNSWTLTPGTLTPATPLSTPVATLQPPPKLE